MTPLPPASCQKRRTGMDRYTITFDQAAQLLDRSVNEVRYLAKRSRANTAAGKDPWPFQVTANGYVTLASVLAFRRTCSGPWSS